MTGNGIKIGIENYAAIVKELALKAVSASLKNPDKITTAMSGQAMETLDAEYYDLVQELRTSCGTNFYLKLVKKMVAAAAAMDHPLAEGLTNKIIDATTLGWPPMNDLGATEIQAIAAGLGPLVEQLILAKDEARDYFFSQVDMPVTSANKAYLETVKAKVSDKESTAPPAVAPVDDLLAAFEDAAGRATQKDPIDTTYYGG
jgi:hypothetical protein